MPSSASAQLIAHLQGEVTTLATLWDVTRTDGEVFYFTDHDENITYGGNIYLTGIGYNRSAIEDKSDMSVDNMDIDGVLDTDYISREDVRAGRFDRAKVVLTVVNYADLTMGGITKRTGWFGEVKQNNNGEFKVELRGLSQALSERFVETYTPGCRVDLGSQKCGIPLVLSEFRRVNNRNYALGKYVSYVDIDDLVFKCTTPGKSAANASQYDESAFEYAMVGDTISDGTVVWTAEQIFHVGFVITSVTSRREFTLDLVTPSGRWDTDNAYFDGGTILFSDGENDSVAKEMSSFEFDTANGGAVTLFLRMPYTVTVGDTGILYPGCSKGIEICASRFSNGINFRGFPHIPGDKYLKDYPDTK